MPKRTASEDQPVRMGMRSYESAREAFASVCREGNVTCILGAGVSLPYGIPTWDALAQRVWQTAFPEAPSPWAPATGARSPREVPQFLPIVFELAAGKLGEMRFVESLRECLYREVKPNWTRGLRRSNHTLAVLARMIVAQFTTKQRRRLLRIITFNADDLLETAARHLQGRRRSGPVQVIARPSTEPVWTGPENRIPIYHIHGFVARQPERPDDELFQVTKHSFSHMLVFTDGQYWRSTATPLSHANRVVTGALSDSHCVFIGLSMTDANLLRWLALRRMEFEADARERATRKLEDEALAKVPAAGTVVRRGSPAQALRIAANLAQRKLVRHFWIRPRSDDPTGFLSDFLRRRGVVSVEIDSWTGPAFARLIDQAFPAR